MTAPGTERRHLQRYGYYLLAVILPLTTLGLRLVCAPTAPERPMLIMYVLPIAVVSYLGGWRPGLLATATVAILTDFFLLSPIHSLAITDKLDFLSWVILTANGLIISFFSGRLHALQKGHFRQSEHVKDLRGALAQSEIRFQAAFEQAGVGIALLDLDYRLLRCNRHLTEILGYDADSLSGLAYQALLADDEWPQDKHDLEALKQGGASSLARQKRCRQKNGQALWTHGTLSLIRNPDGAPNHIVAIFENVEPRKAVEQALTASLSLLKETQDMAAMGSWSWNLETGRVLWSDGIYRLLGRDPSQPPLSLVQLLEHIDRQFSPAFAQAVYALQHQGAAMNMDVEFIHADGGRRWAALRGEARLNASGKPMELQGLIQDITDRKEVAAALASSQEQALADQSRARLAALNLMEDALVARRKAEAVNLALQDSEERLTLAQEAAHVGIWDWDVRHDLAYWSPECERIYGLEPGTLKSQNQWRTLLLPEDLCKLDAMWPELHRSDSFSSEFRIRHANGEIRWLASRGRALLDDQGEVIRLTGVNFDITELKSHRLELERLVRQRTEELQTANDKLLATQFAMDSVGIGIQWIDPGNGQILFANKFAANLLGYSVDEILQLKVSDIDPELPAAAVTDRFTALRTVGKRRFETHHISRVGDVIPVEITSYYHPGQDAGADRVIAFVVDITQRKEAEQALMQAKEAAEAATRAKSAFLANMSHEIRTPMNAIVGLAHLLKRSQATPEQLERLEKIESAADHLLAILNDILDLSKIEAGRLELEMVDFPISAVLDQVTTLVSDQAKAKGLSLKLNTGDVPRWLHGDPTRLRQAMLNYVGNAIKFTERGHIDLRTRVEGRRGDAWLIRFEVQDQGIGIAPEKLNRLFHAFEQADTSTTRKYGGTGLGLALTQRLAGLMGGAAGASSTPGVGSTFWFTALLAEGSPDALPTRPEPVNQHAEEELRHHHGHCRLLVAEDDIINQEVAINLLNDAGLQADLAGNGQEALELARRNRYDLIILDMQMPIMDGLEAARSLRLHAATATTPILAMTANAFTEDRQRCLEAGMNDFIAKPVDPMLLFTTVLKWLNSATPRLPSPLASADPGPDLAQRLALIPGLDVERGLKIARKNPEILLQRLHQFMDLHRRELDDFAPRLAAGEGETLRRVAHTIKGTAGLLGLTGLQDAATALDLAMKQGQTPLDTLVHDVEQAFVALERELPALPNTPEINPDPQRSNQLQQAMVPLTQLRAMLAADDFNSGRSFSEQLPLLQACLPAETLGKLERAIQRFDFAAALAVLNELGVPAQP